LTDQPTAETGAEATTSIDDTMDRVFDALQAEPENGEADEGQDTGTDEAETPPDTNTDTGAEEAAEITDQDGAKAGTAEEPLSPHERWSAERKAEFASLPRKAQEILLSREAETTSYLTQESQKLAEVRREYDAIDAAIGKERKQAWALSGWQSPAHAIGFLVAQSDRATRDTAGFIRDLAAQQGIDLAELAAGGHEPPDPKLSALEQRLARFEQTEQQRQQQAVTEQRQTIIQAVEQFAADKANPYYKDVESDIAAILPGIRQQNPGASHKELLKIAYDKATWAHEPTRAKILADQERLKNLELANAAKKAKAVGSTNVKTSGSATDGNRNKTIDDTMSAVYDRLNARA